MTPAVPVLAAIAGGWAGGATIALIAYATITWRARRRARRATSWWNR